MFLLNKGLRGKKGHTLPVRGKTYRLVLGWGDMLLLFRVSSTVSCQEGCCECCSIRRGLEGTFALHLLQLAIGISKVPSSAVMLV